MSACSVLSGWGEGGVQLQAALLRRCCALPSGCRGVGALTALRRMRTLPRMLDSECWRFR